MKGQCCSLPLPLRNPIGTDFLSNLRVQPRLFLRSHSSHTQPIQFSGPVLCFCDTSFARFCSSDMPGPGVFGWWRMEVCFPVPVNLLSALRSHPGYKLGAWAAWDGRAVSLAGGSAFPGCRPLASRPASCCISLAAMSHGGQPGWCATVQGTAILRIPLSSC